MSPCSTELMKLLFGFTMTKIEYFESESFQKDFKKLVKKFPGLREDFAIVKKAAIELFHLHQIDNHSIFLLQGYETSGFRFYKLKKFACRALKGRGSQSGLRVIYAYDLSRQYLEFLEIYFKSEQKHETKERIERCVKR